MKNVAVTLAWTFAAAFLGATVMGFVPNPLVGEDALFVTNTAHNLVHLGKPSSDEIRRSPPTTDWQEA